MKKRILPALLALCMVLSLLPATVFAEDEPAKCTCDGSPSGCSHENGKCEGTEGLSESQLICNTCKTAKEADEDDGDDDEGGEEEVVTNCPTCGCLYASCSDCTPAEGDNAAACACSTTPCGVSGCKYKVDTNKLCGSYGKVIDTTSHTCEAATACVSGSPANAYLDSCTNSTHETDCAFVCGVNGCTKTKGHDGAHTGGESANICTNDEHCGVAASTVSDYVNHKSTCPVLDTIEETAGKTTAVYTGTHTFTVACTCSTYKHDADSNHGTGTANTCTHTDTIKVDVSVKFEYTSAVDPTGLSKAELAAALEEEMEEQIAAFDHDAADTAAENQWKAENDATHYICSICAAQISAENKSACTMAFDCSAVEHNKGCLSLCTHDGNCPNEEGNSAAHTVWYQVYETAGEAKTLKGQFNVRLDAVELYNSLKKANADDIATAEAAVKAAEAAEPFVQANLDTAKAALAAEQAKGYIVIANHCPVAGIADSTVVAVDGTVTDDTDDSNTGSDTETPKAPEKAEDFADLEGTEWYAEELTALIEKGVFKGSIDGGVYSFKATDPMNTSTLVVLISRVLDLGHNTEGANWDLEATKWATDEGLLEGIEAGEVARKDVILVLWRAAGSPESEQDLSDFEDAADLDGDHLAAMKWAVENGIIKGDGDTGTLKTDDVINRAEMVAVIARFDGVVNK